MTLYETVKSNVTTLQAAERYGLKVGHGGMCKCPFHNDKNPSMKVDKRFHCFGCQADGDVINFTSRLFDLTPKAAALKLANDFSIQHDPQQVNAAIRKPRMISEKEIFEHKVSYCYQELVNYRNLLVQWQQQYAPMSPDEEWHPLFIHAVHNLETVEQELDTLLTGSDYEKREIVSDHLRKKKNHREDYAMEPTVNVPVYRESAAHARKFGELEQYRKSHFANIDCKKDIEQAISENFDGFRLNTVNWLPVKIDTSIFYRGNGIISYFNPLYSFVLNHTLYMFGENNNQVEPKSSAMALISFDLTTGQHQSFQINDATNCCPYKDNQILLLCPASNKKMKLCLLQTDTGEVSDMNIEIPFPDNSKNGKESIGGLAYDKDRDVIFFFVEGKVWKSKEHSELYSVELFDEYSSDYSFPAWTTSKGEYAIFMYGLLYIVDIAE